MEYPVAVITIYFNSLVGIADRVLQICYFAFTYKDDRFVTPTAQQISLTFVIFPFGLNFVMMFIYCLFHHEKILTPLVKIKNFFLYIISSELLLPIGINKSFITKFSEAAENPLVTMKLINALHVLFVSLPQILIISINSSANGNFQPLDIASLVLSCFFIVWSFVYYVLCAIREIEYDNYITYSTYPNNYG